MKRKQNAMGTRTPEQLELDFQQAVIELAENDLPGAIRELTDVLRTMTQSPLVHSVESLRSVLHQLANVHRELADLWLPVNVPRTYNPFDYERRNGDTDEGPVS